MPSSRASSPLSSATPSPPPEAGPSTLSSPGSPFSVTSITSPPPLLGESERKTRSNTSSTAPKSEFSADDDDDSELTEEEDDKMEPGQEVTGEDEQDLDALMRNQDIDDEFDLLADSKRNVTGSPGLDQAPSFRSSPSLTPPPPSVAIKTKILPDLIREPVSSASSISGDDEEDGTSDEQTEEKDVKDEKEVQSQADDRIEEDVEKSKIPGASVDLVPVVADLPAEAEDTDDDGDGDVTMRPTDEALPLDEEHMEEQREVDLPEESVKKSGPAIQEPEDMAEDVSPEEQASGDPEENDASDTPTMPLPLRSLHPSHAPPPSSAHIRALLILEVKFAALRDRLYVERMEETAAEEQMILEGGSPVKVQLMARNTSCFDTTLQNSSGPQGKAARGRFEKASRNHERAQAGKRVGQVASVVLLDERDQLHWEDFEATWSKRRRLAREKNDIETVRYVKPIPRVGGKVRTFDWTAGASPAKASETDIAKDLAALDTRNVQAMQMAQQVQAQHMSRHASPAVYAPPPHLHAVQNGATSTLSSAINGTRQASTPQTYSYSHQPAYNPPRPVPVHTVQAVHPGSSQLLSAGPSRPTTQARPQGRTVPTTSDLFESGRKDPTVAPLPWIRPEPRPPNGHAVSAPAPPPKEEPHQSRFPGLAEYLSNRAPASSPGTGYGGILNAGSKILSPPKSQIGLLGPFARPTPFASGPAASATMAGTNYNRIP